MQTNTRETFLIRPARQQDAARIASVHVVTWQVAYRGQLPDEYLDSLSVETRAAWWEKNLGEGNPGVTLVAEDDGGIVGFISVGPGPVEGDLEVGEVYAIYVAPASMGRGIGSVMMEAGLTALRNQGFTEARLWVLTSNEKARGFYERIGWQATGQTKVDTSGGQAFHETRYRVALSLPIPEGPAP